MKVYPVDAIASAMKELDSNIDAYAHSVYNGKNRHYKRILKSNVNYNKIYSSEDIFERFKNDKLDISYLNKLEKELSFPNLWLNIVHEREIYALDHWIPGVIKYNEEELLRWLQATARHIEYILDDCRPDVYLDLMSVSLMRELTRRMCSYRGILWIIPLQTRYKNKAVIVDNKKEYIKNYQVRYDELLNGSSENLEEAEKEIYANS